LGYYLEPCRGRSNMSSAGASIVFLKVLILVSTLTGPFVVACAADMPKPVFVKGTCLDPISSGVLSSLDETIRNSQKYRRAHNLGDGDQMGVVLTINVTCTERKNVAAIATVFGAAKCFSATNCHVAIDGSSLRSDLCDSSTAAACVRALYNAFDDYMSNLIEPPLK
jgi:hypothetical protein